jgi:uncharacterized iron-regulated membrane protein
MWVHERLGWFVATLGAISASLVAAKIIIARSRLGRLLDVSEPLSEPLQNAFANAAAALGVPMPAVAYLDLGMPVACTIFGPMVLLSRGFAREQARRSLMDWLAPAMAILLAVALFLSHRSFERNLPYLETHHC